MNIITATSTPHSKPFTFIQLTPQIYLRSVRLIFDAKNYEISLNYFFDYSFFIVDFFYIFAFLRTVGARIAVKYTREMVNIYEPFNTIKGERKNTAFHHNPQHINTQPLHEANVKINKFELFFICLILLASHRSHSLPPSAPERAWNLCEC